MTVLVLAEVAVRASQYPHHSLTSSQVSVDSSGGLAILNIDLKEASFFRCCRKGLIH